MTLLAPISVEAGTLRTHEKNPVALPVDVRFVSTGPAISPTRRLRVVLFLEEAYFSVAVDELEYGADESEPDRILASHFLNGSELAPQILRSRLTALSFTRWLGPREFELREEATSFRVRFDGDGVFEVTAVSK